MQKSGALKVTTPSPREVRMTREFNAPRRLVWDCYTKPELIMRWAGGPPGWSMSHCEVDLRVGGKWRWVTTGPNGEEMGFGGVYKEVDPPSRLVSTEQFDQPWYDGDAENVLELTEANGKTTLTVTVRYASQEIRDMVLKTPMAVGMEFGFSSLEQLLATLGA
jgi:uncharacterized protein YndB with AHSA1/START domain